MKTTTLLAAAALAATSFRATAATITEYPLAPNATPLGIALGPDGNIWFTESVANMLGRITAQGQITEFPLGAAQSFPSYVLPALNGRVYFGEPGTGKIGSYDVLGGNGLVESPANGGIGGALGPNRYLWLVHGNASVTEWFTDSDAGSTGCTMSDGQPHEFESVVYNNEGRLYLLDSGLDAFVELASVSTCSFQVDLMLSPGAGARSLVLGPDGQYWFVERGVSRIARFGTGGFHEYQLAAFSEPNAIVPSPDGTLWFTERGANKIGRITPAGTITEYPVPTAGSHPNGIAVGADGSVWFTEETGNKIGRLRLRSPGDVNDDGNADVSDVFYLINWLFAGGPAPR
jgi:virginiamycin B lyase